MEHNENSPHKGMINENTPRGGTPEPPAQPPAPQPSEPTEDSSATAPTIEATINVGGGTIEGSPMWSDGSPITPEQQVNADGSKYADSNSNTQPSQEMEHEELDAELGTTITTPFGDTTTNVVSDEAVATEHNPEHEVDAHEAYEATDDSKKKDGGSSGKNKNKSGKK